MLALRRQAPDLVSDGMLPHGMQLDATLQRADIAESLGLTEEAAALRGAGLQQARELGGKAYAERQRQMAGTWLEQGRPHEALVALRAARDLCLATGEHIEAARCTASLASALEDLRDDERAIFEVQTGYAQLRAGGWEPQERALDADSVAQTIESLLSMMSGATAADPLSSDAAPIPSVERARAEGAWSDMMQVEARCARRCGDYDRARALFAKVRATFLGYAKPALDYQLLMIEVSAGRHAAALRLIEDLSVQMQSGALRRKLGHVVSLKGRVLLESGEPAAALVEFLRADLEVERFPDLQLSWTNSEREGDAFAALGQLEAALAAYERAAETIAWLRRAPLGHRLDSLYLVDKLNALCKGIDLAARLGNAPVAYRLIEQVKARQLAACIGVPGRQSEETGRSSSIDELSRQLAATESSDASPERIRNLIGERETLVEQLRIADPHWRKLTEPLPTDLARDIAALARAGAAGLALHLHGRSLVALVLWRGEAQVFQRTLSDDSRAALDGILAQGAQSAAEPVTPTARSSMTLEDLLTVGAIERLSEAPAWCVVPHGPLHLLRWPLLTLAGQPLSIKRAVSLLPTFGLLHAPGSAGSRPGVVHAIGVSNRAMQSIEAATECETIASIYGARGVPVAPPCLGADDTREAMRLLLNQPQAEGALPHVACHGELDTVEPMASSLKLSNGRFDATEVALGRCHFSEVILSACSVGRRALQAGDVPLVGDEVLGLVVGLLEAGARYVLVSLTPARDIATLELMKLYHEGRANSLRPAEALRHAQQVMWEEGIFSPEDWGGFVLFGRP